MFLSFGKTIVFGKAVLVGLGVVVVPQMMEFGDKSETPAMIKTAGSPMTMRGGITCF